MSDVTQDPKEVWRPCGGLHPLASVAACLGTRTAPRVLAGRCGTYDLPETQPR